MEALRSFPDSGILIDSARGRPPRAKVAFSFLTNANVHRIFLTSSFIWLETMPKALYMGSKGEIELYSDFFEDPAIEWCRAWEQMEQLSRAESVRHGLSALDALHLAAAHLLGADEFVTTELPGKAMYRTELVRVVYLYAGLA